MVKFSVSLNRHVFVIHLYFFLCLGRAVCRDYSISRVSSFIVLRRLDTTGRCAVIITKTRLFNMQKISPPKTENFQKKNSDIFHIVGTCSFDCGLCIVCHGLLALPLTVLSTCSESRFLLGTWRRRKIANFCHYENKPIQIYWKFYHQKNENFRIKILIFFIFLLKT